MVRRRTIDAAGCFDLYFLMHGRVPSRFFELYLFFLNSISFDHISFDHAIVDLDGTMVGTIGDFAVALNAMLSELGMAASPTQISSPLEKTVQEGLPGFKRGPFLIHVLILVVVACLHPPEPVRLKLGAHIL